MPILLLPSTVTLDWHSIYLFRNVVGVDEKSSKGYLGVRIR